MKLTMLLEGKSRILIVSILITLAGALILFYPRPLSTLKQRFISKKRFYECPLAPKEPQDRRKSMNKLTITTFNAQWLFIKGGKGGILHCPSSQCPWHDKKMAREHLEKIALRLSKLDSDIINLQEVEDCETLEELRASMPNGHEYRAFMKYGGDTALGQNVALLTRVDPYLDLKRSEKHVNVPLENSHCPDLKRIGKKAISAKHYYTQFKIPGLEKPLMLVGLHFLARPLDKRRCAGREGQAQVVTDLLQEHDGYVIIAGDFNDYDARVERVRNGRLPISGVLEMFYKSRNLTNSILLSDSMPLEWFTMQTTLGKRKKKTLIDHILISSELRDKVEEVVIDKDFLGISDHFPIKMTLNLST